MRDRRHVFDGKDIESSLMSDRIAESLPVPMPFTITSTILRAGRLDLFGDRRDDFRRGERRRFLRPRKPSEPADAHASTLPVISVTVITVLLYEAFI